MAEQERPVRRRVALKILKLGMDTRTVVARFEAERQALALMDHPHIARVFDGGATDTGRPCFIMEYVTGDAITKFADDHRLSVPDRLALFAQVCPAVQHAHQKGVIHRDIKPNNVLVSMTDGKPFAKVIDFGIAKATAQPLTEKTLFTEHRQLIGTPEYMSPEQAAGSADIDTRTDVYALGVLLYELLSGATPFDAKRLRSAAYGELQRILREEEPPAPSIRMNSDLASLFILTAARREEPRWLTLLVRGELDWIVLKARDKDRARRYETPNALADDVHRHPAGEAVVAAPPTAGYKVKKFIRRHRGPVIAASPVAGALLAGFEGTSVGFVRANRQTEIAVEQRAVAIAARQEEARQRELADVKTAEAERERAEADWTRQLVVEKSGQLEWNSYMANEQMAGVNLDRGGQLLLRQRLDACPMRHCEWDWQWLNAEADTSIAQLKGHTQWVTSAAFSPDGTRIVTASWDNTARAWDSIPNRNRYAERRASARGQNGFAIVIAWHGAVKAGTEQEFVVPLQ